MMIHVKSESFIASFEGVFFKSECLLLLLMSKEQRHPCERILING